MRPTPTRFSAALPWRLRAHFSDPTPPSEGPPSQHRDGPHLDTLRTPDIPAEGLKVTHQDGGGGGGEMLATCSTITHENTASRSPAADVDHGKSWTRFFLLILVDIGDTRARLTQQMLRGALLERFGRSFGASLQRRARRKAMLEDPSPPPPPPTFREQIYRVCFASRV